MSDGLGEDLHRLCDASAVGVVLDSDRIPVAAEAAAIAEAIDLPAWVLPFVAGGEFQFLATTAPSERAAGLAMGLNEIGSIIEGDSRALVTPGNPEGISLPRTGHRDARNMSFADEVTHLLKELGCHV